MANKFKVEIDHSKFWKLAGQHPIHMHVAVGAELRKHGIPIEGGIEFQGIKHGRISMWNEYRNGKRWCCYEWTPSATGEDEGDEL